MVCYGISGVVNNVNSLNFFFALLGLKHFCIAEAICLVYQNHAPWVTLNIIALLHF